MGRVLRTLLLVGVCLLAAATVWAQDASEEDEYFDDEAIRAHPDIRATFTLPDREAGNELLLGGANKILIGVENTGTETVNITSVGAALTMPKDAEIFVQNFTRQVESGRLLKGGDEIYMAYSILPHASLDTLDYLLLGDVEYQSIPSTESKNGQGEDSQDDEDDVEFEARLFRTTFANDTVWITKNYLFGIDFEAIGVVLVALGCVGGAVYLIMTLLGATGDDAQGKRNKKHKKEAEKPTYKPHNPTDYLAHLQQPKKSSAVKRNKKNKKQA